ncbi:DnaJ domain-containing protein [Hygrophoropsis aurantiaca]|uniref:DnaJ domain-containing protein n=1 Tax=Hygrophoropsis aurantiaca TaxID=72124 RepID=A0ACB8A1J0_9AGAM|nr:DnaJ domain-containing protein [Hygrophoropsis aurantiaca]
MATQLYETLGLSRDASAEQVRKAYRKKALDTHPDRLPPGASAADKSTSEELFRKVNNAYEVLSDPQKREVYDRYGVFPPPTQEQEISGSRQRRQTRHDPFSGPFFQDPFSMGGFGSGFGFGNSSGNPFHHNTAGFTDPFVLFESIFGNLDRAFRDPFFGDPFSPPGFGQGMFNSSMPPFGSPFGFVGGNSWSGASMSGNNGNGMRWISESRSSRTVNGVTESKWIRKDSSGNEHITYTYADGTQRTTINGIDQARADNGRIAGADGGGTTPAEPRQPDDHHSRRCKHPFTLKYSKI